MMELLFNNVSGLQPPSLSKKKLQHSCFSVNFVKFYKNTSFREQSGQSEMFKKCDKIP